jgi:hypothetical protein
MARWLEVFKQAPPKAAPLPTAPAAAPAPPSVAALDDSVLSFIEVGGPRETTEASADVLATALPTPRKVALAKPPELRYRSVRLLPAAPARPRWATFSPRYAGELIVAHDPRHPVSKQYTELLHALLAPRTDKSPLLLWFLGAAPKCGTTTVVLNLALTAAQSGPAPVTVVEVGPRRALPQRVGLPSGSPFFQDKSKRLRFVCGAGREGDSLAAILQNEPEGLILVEGPNLEEMPEDVSAMAEACDAVYVVASDEERPPVDDLGRTVDGWIIAQD